MLIKIRLLKIINSLSLWSRLKSVEIFETFSAKISQEYLRIFIDSVSFWSRHVTVSPNIDSNIWSISSLNRNRNSQMLDISLLFIHKRYYWKQIKLFYLNQKMFSKFTAL